MKSKYDLNQGPVDDIIDELRKQYGQYIDFDTYVDPYRVEQSLFLEGEIPDYHPLSMDYRDYWREFRRKCIEGYWQSGVWMPGSLFFYVNANTIKRNVNGSKVKQFARPILRDVEWMVHYNAIEARGFSGFKDDPYFSCHVALTLELTDEQIKDRYCYGESGFSQVVYNNLFKKNGERKLYEPPRYYLRKIHQDNYGIPVFLNNSKNKLTFGSREFGKAMCKRSTIIHREDGPVVLEDLKIGDKIYDDSGKLTTVTNIWEQGKLPLYRVMLSDYRTIDVCKEHLWEVIEKQKSKVLNTGDLLKNYIINRKKTEKIKSGKEYRYYLKHSKPLEYPEKELPLDPYTLGVLIGDGGLTQGVSFTSANPEIINYIPYEVTKRSQKYAYGIKNIKNIIKELNLNCKSECKFIPPIYKYGSVEQRLELLKGLMDTDGSIHAKKQIIEYSTFSTKLAHDVKSLVRSLGMYCVCSKRQTKGLYSYRLFITPNQQIFKLKRKAELLTNFKKSRASKCAIIEITPLEIEKDAACIEVDNQSKLFVANDFIVTHNSYIAANITLHEWLFDGLTEYLPSGKVNTSSEIIMGAFDAKYSGETLSKAKIGLEKLPGAYETYDKKYPSPLAKKYKGSWGPSKEVIAEYPKKIKGTWENVGTKSVIKHRTFKDNPFAAQGTRPGLIMCEEIGSWPNFLECYGAMVDNQREGSRKFGSMFMWGTGGQFDVGVAAALEVFYNPKSYDCLVFDDIWENRGNICFFMPAYLALNNTKDSKGRTIMNRALADIFDKRDELAGTNGSKNALQKEMQNRPIKPSEMFLTKTGNYFPIVELKERINVLDNIANPDDWKKKVILSFDPNIPGGVKYQIDTRNELTAIDKYPWREADKEGCVVIYEFPITDKFGNVPKDLYIIGHDPVATDSASGESFAATYVLKTRQHWQQYGHDEVVACHITRPYDGRAQINENLLKLSMLYGGAIIYFENMVGNVKEYFEKMKRLDLLARQPTTLFNKKASFDGKMPVVYGYPMSNRKTKLDGVQYVRDWLLEERGKEENKIIRNLDRIWDRALLQELVAFDLDGNFDRVMAFMGCVIGLNEMFNQYHNSIALAAQESNRNSLSFLVSNSLIGGTGNNQESKEMLKHATLDFSFVKNFK